MEPVEATRETILRWARDNRFHRPGVTLGEINAGRLGLGLPPFLLLRRDRVEPPLPSPHFGDLTPDSYSKKVTAHVR